MPDFSFLLQRSGFQIAESLVDAGPADSYLWALLAGLTNTLTVVAVALPMATFLGLIAGLLRLSRHPLLHRAVAAMVEPVRNTPVLLQLFVWYSLLLNLPGIREAWQPVPGVFISNRGLAVPLVHGAAAPVALILAALLVVWFWKLPATAAMSKQSRLSSHRGKAMLSLASLVSCALLVKQWGLEIDFPVQRGLGLSGGWTLSPEFTALVLGLTVFHASYISDIVRGAVLAVPLGQVDAARALGMRGASVARVAIYPFAARAAVPPYANQCLMLLKNSTLAIAIGYQDLMAIINTTITQTGRAFEGMALAAAFYLGVSLLLASALTRYNAHVTRHGIDGSGVARLGQRLGLPSIEVTGLWGSTWRSLISASLILVCVWAFWMALRWGLLQAVWSGTAAACEGVTGACWAVFGENWRLLLFGTMAPEHRVPAILAACSVLAGVVMAASPRLSFRWRIGLAVFACLMALVLLAGFGTDRPPIVPVMWGGVLVTVVLAVAAISSSLPIALALALLRRSDRRWLCTPAVVLIETVRAIPLVTQLLLVTFVVPMLLGGDWSAAKFQMALVALTLHTACLLAEVLRGAMQAVPASQIMSARALGMRPATVLWFVLLPQAGRIAAPAALGVFVGAVKDTSLVMVIGVFDILSAAKAVVASTTWRPYYVEVYASVALFYFSICLWLSRLAERLQKQGGSI